MFPLPEWSEPRDALCLSSGRDIISKLPTNRLSSTLALICPLPRRRQQPTLFLASSPSSNNSTPTTLLKSTSSTTLGRAIAATVYISLASAPPSSPTAVSTTKTSVSALPGSDRSTSRYAPSLISFPNNADSLVKLPLSTSLLPSFQVHRELLVLCAPTPF